MDARLDLAAQLGQKDPLQGSCGELSRKIRSRPSVLGRLIQQNHVEASDLQGALVLCAKFSSTTTTIILPAVWPDLRAPDCPWLTVFAPWQAILTSGPVRNLLETVGVLIGCFTSRLSLSLLFCAESTSLMHLMHAISQASSLSISPGSFPAARLFSFLVCALPSP